MGWVPSVNVVFLIPAYEKVQNTSPHYFTATIPLHVLVDQSNSSRKTWWYKGITRSPLNGVLLSYFHTDCLLWKLLELELFCSKEENSWHRAQLLHGSSYYANYPGSSHFIKALFSPFTYTKQEAKGAALICPRPWRQYKVPLFSQSIVLYGSTCSHKWKGKTDPFCCTVQPLL